VLDEVVVVDVVLVEVVLVEVVVVGVVLVDVVLVDVVVVGVVLVDVVVVGVVLVEVVVVGVVLVEVVVVEVVPVEVELVLGEAEFGLELTAPFPVVVAASIWLVAVAESLPPAPPHALNTKLKELAIRRYIGFLLNNFIHIILTFRLILAWFHGGTYASEQCLQEIVPARKKNNVNYFC
jgi:hypothetical protein